MLLKYVFFILNSSHSQDQENMKETKNNCMSPEINSEKHQIANNDGVVVIDKDASYLQNKIQAITRLDHSVVMQILYSNRENINLIQEVFRQVRLIHFNSCYLTTNLTSWLCL